MTKPVHIIGAGMAGSEAAWACVSAGVPVVLHEMRPKVGTDAHKTGGFAELVCSNSFRSDDADQNAVGLLHWEMREAGSLIMATADRHQVPAGGALAVSVCRSTPRLQDRSRGVAARSRRRSGCRSHRRTGSTSRPSG